MAGKWTDADRAIVKEFTAWMEKEGLFGADAAARLDISTGSLSQMLGMTYTGRVARITAEMERVLRRERMRAKAPKEPPYATTSITQQVIDVLNTAHVERRIVLILGPTGVGKTVGAKRYCEAEPTTIYFSCGPKATPKAITRKLASALGIDPVGSAYGLRDQIAAALRESGRLVIADEIDYVLEDALQTLRLIHDLGGMGLALIGTEAYLERLRARKSTTVRQLLGRVAYARIVNHCSEDDLANIAAPFGLDDAALDTLVGGSAGQARRAVLALCAAQRISGDGVNAKHIRKAFETLMPVEE